MSIARKIVAFPIVTALYFVIISNAYGENHEKLIQQYKSGDLTDKRIAIKSLKQFKEKYLFSFFQEASGHSDRFIRGHALEGISHFQTGEVLRILKKSLLDPSSFIVQNTIPLFNNFPLPEAVETLLPLLKHKDEQIVSSVIEVLARIGNKDIVFNIAPYLNDSRKNIQSVTYLNMGLVFQKYKNEFTRELDPNFEITLKQNTLKTIDKLTELFLLSFMKTWQKGTIPARKDALWCLGVMVGTFLGKMDSYIMSEKDNKLLSLAESIKNRLISIIPFLLTSFEKMSEENLRWHLITCLSEFKSQEALPVFFRGLKDDFYPVRVGSLQGLIEQDNKDSISEILPLLNDPMIIVRIKAVEAVERMGSAENASRLIFLLNDNNTQIKWHIAKALGSLKNKAAVQPLISLIGSKSELIRSMAVQSLGRLGFPEAVYPLINASNDESYLVREQAGYALGKLINTKETFLILIKLLSDENKHVRRSAFDSFFLILKNSENKAKYKKMLPMLFPVLKNKDIYIRKNASKFLKLIWITE